MQKAQKQIALFMALVLCLMPLVACTAAQILTDIEIAAKAAATAAPIIIAAANLPPAVLTYVTAANAGIGCAASAADAGGLPATVSAAILKCLAGLNIAPDLPPGVAQTVATVVQALANDIANILTKYSTSPMLKTTPAAVVWHPSWADHRKITSIQKLVASTGKVLTGH